MNEKISVFQLIQSSFIHETVGSVIFRFLIISKDSIKVLLKRWKYFLSSHKDLPKKNYDKKLLLCPKPPQIIKRNGWLRSAIDFPQYKNLPSHDIHKKIQSQLNIKATVQNDKQAKKCPKFHHRMVEDIKSSLFPKPSHDFRKSLFHYVAEMRWRSEQKNPRGKRIQTHTEKRTKMKEFFKWNEREFFIRICFCWLFHFLWKLLYSSHLNIGRCETKGLKISRFCLFVDNGYESKV